MATFIRSLSMNPGAGGVPPAPARARGINFSCSSQVGWWKRPGPLAREEDASRCVASICEEFGDRFTDLRPRVVQTLCGALDSDKPFATKYGALQCTVALGPAALHRRRTAD